MREMLPAARLGMHAKKDDWGVPTIILTKRKPATLLIIWFQQDDNW